MSYWDAHKLLAETTNGAHPVSCVDCHDSKTMELRVTRPGFIAGIQKLAASDAAVPHLPSVEAGAAATGQGRTTPTSTAPARRCAPSSAGSATSSTTAARA